ncbi:hypothetical protein MUB16_00530 [Priestia sp. OVL9]|nr:hypothetical protein [Priestia sp. OVL9]
MKRNKKSKNQVDTYRPTVRYHSMYRTYVDSLFQSTELDRNQIMRCALFTAAHNPVFLALMNQYKMNDVPLLLSMAAFFPPVMDGTRAQHRRERRRRT